MSVVSCERYARPCVSATTPNLAVVAVADADAEAVAPGAGVVKPILSGMKDIPPAVVAPCAAESPGTLRLAYIDPATGSLIIQGVLAFLAATAVVTRAYWSKIKGWFGASSAKQSDDGDLNPGASPETPPNDG